MQKASIGGVLAIVASALGMVGSLFMFAVPALMNSSAGLGSEYGDAFTGLISGFYIVLGVIGLLIGALGVVGGIFAIRRKMFGLALAGAVVSSIIFYPLGIVSVILISMGHAEFGTPAPAAAVALESVSPPSLPLPL